MTRPALRPALFLALATAPLTACLLDGGDSPSNQPPGLDPAGCAMTFTPHRIDRVTLPSARPVTGLDLNASGSIDNQLGNLHAIMVEYTEFDVNPAIAGHLDAGELHWVLEVGRCTDGGDEVRVQLARATDVDDDGRLEVVERGIAAVGEAGPHLVTAHGVATVPLGFLTDGGGALAVDAWQLGFALATDLTVGADGTLDGQIGFGLGWFSDAAMSPLAAYATSALDDGTSTADFWIRQDTDRDGVISVPEIRVFVDQLLRPDLDVGACDELGCYNVLHDDGVNDHTSAGLTIHATPVVLE